MWFGDSELFSILPFGGGEMNLFTVYNIYSSKNMETIKVKKTGEQLE